MKYIFSIFILVVIISCSKNSSQEKEKYKIINLILSDLKSKISNGLILENDTITYNKFVLDCSPRGEYRIDTVSGEKILIYDNFNLLDLCFFFDNTDILYINNQIKNKSINKWERSYLKDFLLTDTSVYKSDTIGDTIYISDTPDSRIWRLFKNKKHDYVSISEPLINTSLNKSITTLSIYQPEYYLLQTIETIKNKEGQWSINTRRIFALKLFYDNNITDRNYDMSEINLGIWFQ